MQGMMTCGSSALQTALVGVDFLSLLHAQLEGEAGEGFLCGLPAEPILRHCAPGRRPGHRARKAPRSPPPKPKGPPPATRPRATALGCGRRRTRRRRSRPPPAWLPRRRKGVFLIFLLVDKGEAGHQYRREGGEDPPYRLRKGGTDQRRDHRNRATEGEADGEIPKPRLPDPPRSEPRDEVVASRAILGRGVAHLRPTSKR